MVYLFSRVDFFWNVFLDKLDSPWTSVTILGVTILAVLILAGCQEVIVEKKDFEL